MTRKIQVGLAILALLLGATDCSQPPGTPAPINRLATIPADAPKGTPEIVAEIYMTTRP